MIMFQPVSKSADRVMAALIAGLELEFGRDAAEGLAQRFVEAEGMDFHWDARTEERWLGSYEAAIDDELVLDRVAILGRFQGRWFVASCIVDGNGMLHGMSGCRYFSRSDFARNAFVTLH